VEAVSAPIIDSDQHLYEPRSLWVDHIDPGHRADALMLEDDELGYTWLAWRGQRLEIADVHQPGDVDGCGRHRQRRGEPASYRYDEALPDAYWDPGARSSWLDAAGVDQYFARHVRVSSFSYEDPRRLTGRSGDLFMCCSDFPHSEGTATPLADYRAAGCDPAASPGLFHDNATFLLGPLQGPS
jgi:hypothetical protein